MNIPQMPTANSDRFIQGLLYMCPKMKQKVEQSEQNTQDGL